MKSIYDSEFVEYGWRWMGTKMHCMKVDDLFGIMYHGRIQVNTTVDVAGGIYSEPPILK